MSISAMKEALEALEGNCTNPLADPEQAKKEDEAIAALRQALAEPEQEPLVWMNKHGHVASFQNEEYKDPLYTAPPKREWVGLTRDEVLEIEETTKHPLAFYRAIEAKLKEKNNG